MNYYEILRVNKDASQQEIDEAYHILMEKIKSGESTDKQLPARGEVSEAYSVLQNPTRRGNYDETYGDETLHPMKYFTAYAKVFLVIAAIAEVLTLCGNFASYGEYGDAYGLWAANTILCGVMLAAYIYIAIFMRKFRLLAYKINLAIILIAQVQISIRIAVCAAMETSVPVMLGVITTWLFPMAFIFAHILYFQKRRFAFESREKTGRAPCSMMSFSVPPVYIPEEETKMAVKRTKRLFIINIAFFVVCCVFFIVLLRNNPDLADSRIFKMYLDGLMQI